MHIPYTHIIYTHTCISYTHIHTIYTHTIKYYLAEQNKVLSFSENSTELKVIMFNKTSQTGKDTGTGESGRSADRHSGTCCMPIWKYHSKSY